MRRTRERVRRYSSGMMVWMGIALVAFMAGGLLVWVLAKAGGAAEQQRSAALAAELAQKNAALEALQRESANREKTYAERDAGQREQIAGLQAGSGHLQQ